MKKIGNLLILGDSYSTFEGYVPEGHAVYYNLKGRPDETGTPTTDVRSVDDTWWKKVETRTGGKIILNDSWSGSTVCYTAYDGRDCSGDSSFITRIDKLIMDGFFDKNEIDAVFVFGLTNDSWAGSPVGEPKYTNLKREDLYSALPALCCLLTKIKKAAKNAEVYFLKNTGLDEAISEKIPEICQKTGVKLIEFTEIDKVNNHPTKLGMEQIAERVVSEL